MQMIIERTSWPLRQPFSITGHTFTTTETVRVTLISEGCRGQGEAVGVYYNDDTVDSMVAQLEAVQHAVETGVGREDVQSLLPPGGALNALDSALWDLEAKRSGTSIWQLLDLTPQPLRTVCTVGIEAPEIMADMARQYSRYPNLKIKLSGDAPIERLEAIRAARPDATLIIDVNQGWSFDELREYAPMAEKLGVAMIEQPLPRGADEWLAGYKSPVPLGADESCLHVGEYARVAPFYDVINIKLDKCGGLTQGLELVELARKDGKALMVGNMMGTSLSMAPSFVIGQHCRFVDIDGPLLLARDIVNGLHYGEGGVVDIPSPALWG